jgi:predicted amidophosphoribosyltransferase
VIPLKRNESKTKQGKSGKSKLMFCSNCENEKEEGDNFCLHCGQGIKVLIRCLIALCRFIFYAYSWKDIGIWHGIFDKI